MNGRPVEPLQDRILSLLVENGYSVLPKPFQVGDITLDLPCVASGPKGRLDLVVIVDRPEGREERLRLYWQVQRLVRALDAAESRRTISVVVVGGVGDADLSADLQAVARVLPVDESLPVQRLIAPLLGLTLPEATQVTLDGLAQVRDGSKGRYKDALEQIIGSAPSGSKIVTKKYVSWVDDSFRLNRQGARHD